MTLPPATAPSRSAAPQPHGRVACLRAIVVHPGDPKDGRLKDRHGRLLATITVDGKDVGEIMIAEGLARPWVGKRQPWCE
jgi:endonuclease YncB( thermonuclease family)